MYEIETRSHTPVNLFAGDFPTVTEVGTAGAALEERTPVTKDSNGKIVAVAPAGAEGTPPATTGDVIGITAATAEKDGPVVYYLTGEFFADAINLPEGIEIADIKDPLRKISIFLR